MKLGTGIRGGRHVKIGGAWSFGSRKTKIWKESSVDAWKNSMLQCLLVKNVNRGWQEVDQPKHKSQRRFRWSKTRFANQSKTPKRSRLQRPLAEALRTRAVGGTANVSLAGCWGWQSQAGGGGGERFNDVVKEDMKLACAREEDAEDTAGWRLMIGWEPSLCRTAKRRSRSQVEVSTRATRTPIVSMSAKSVGLVWTAEENAGYGSPLGFPCCESVIRVWQWLLYMSEARVANVVQKLFKLEYKINATNTVESSLYF